MSFTRLSGGRIKRSFLHIVSWMQRSSSILFWIAYRIKHETRDLESGLEEPMNMFRAKLLVYNFEVADKHDRPKPWLKNTS